MPVNRRRVRLLVDALRSGEWTQGRTVLARRTRDGWRHCCLGVACEVAIANGLPLKTWTLPGGIKVFDGNPCVMPAAVRDWYGFNPCNLSPHIVSPAHPARRPIPMAAANDTYNWPFLVIAGAVEHTYLNDEVELL